MTWPSTNGPHMPMQCTRLPARPASSSDSGRPPGSDASPCRPDPQSATILAITSIVDAYRVCSASHLTCVKGQQRRPRHPARCNGRRSIMSYKTILVHCDADPKVSHRLAIAVELAQRHGAHLVGVHVQEPFNMPALVDGTVMTDNLFAAHEATAKADLVTAAAAFDKALKGTHLSREWRTETGYADTQLGVHVRYADLVVLGQNDPEASISTPPDLPEAIALATGRPALVVPHIGAPTKPGRTVMLCWNASRESARAATDALPFLRAADKVIVLSVDPKPSANGHGAEPGADVATWLSRHGVKVTVQRDV